MGLPDQGRCCAERDSLIDLKVIEYPGEVSLCPPGLSYLVTDDVLRVFSKLDRSWETAALLVPEKKLQFTWLSPHGPVVLMYTPDQFYSVITGHETKTVVMSMMGFTRGVALAPELVVCVGLFGFAVIEIADHIRFDQIILAESSYRPLSGSFEEAMVVDARCWANGRLLLIVVEPPMGGDQKFDRYQLVEFDIQSREFGFHHEIPYQPSNDASLEHWHFVADTDEQVLLVGGHTRSWSYENPATAEEIRIAEWNALNDDWSLRSVRLHEPVSHPGRMPGDTPHIKAVRLREELIIATANEVLTLDGRQLAVGSFIPHTLHIADGRPVIIKAITSAY